MEIELETVPFDLSFHPSVSIVAVGLISGHVHLYRYGDLSSDSAERLWSQVAHETSCRGVRFIESGKTLLTASSDCSILAIDVETGRHVARLDNAHPHPINCLTNLTEATVASGDDEGIIKIWDIRKNTCCSVLKAHEDYVSDMEFVPHTMQVLATSGDGRLSVSSIHKGKVQVQSEFAEDELLSVVLMKNGRKVVCGSEEGVLLLYSWKCWKDCSDRFVGHPDSVDAMLKLNEDTLVTGAGDGIIRVISILPNKMVGVIGEHENYPIENLAVSHDYKVLGSVSHDQNLKLWDISYFLETDGPEEEMEKTAHDQCMDMELDPDTEDLSKGSKGKKKKGQSSTQTSCPDFFSDL
eukprot:TRINITY_DN1042_c0_g2_i1.p1 TRINITY_DN1042_c0_g2~~TRINITY_DN1042_c0_g2_i1.p1  ORF type:complete len:353 (+),score=62.93 TRINITY_DN1042_c0_g2_i1:221-1279(+)